MTRSPDADSLGPAAARKYFFAANALTIIRLLLIPVATWLLLHAGEHPQFRSNALAILIFQQATDIADGHLARRGKRFADLPNLTGAILDPIADKLYLNVTFFALAATGWFSWTLAYFFVIKDALLIAGWGLLTLLRGSAEVRPNFFGKAADSLQAFLVFFVILQLPELLLSLWTWLTIAFVISASISYAAMALGSILRDNKKK